MWFYAYYVLLLFSPPLLRDYEFVTRGIRIDQLLLLATFAALAVNRTQLIAVAGRTRIGLSLAAFVAASCVSAVLAMLTISNVNFGTTIASVWGQSRAFIAFAVSYALATSLDPGRRAKLGVVIPLCAVGIVAIATMQYVGSGTLYEMSMEYYSRKREVDSLLQAVGMGRAFGTFDGQPNVLGSFCVLAIAVTAAYLAVARGAQRITLLGGTLGLIAWGLAISWSRGAYAATVVAGLILLLVFGRRNGMKVVMGVSLVATLAYYGVPEEAQVRFHQLASGTSYQGASIFESRHAFWESNMALFRENPVFGVRGVPMDPPDSLYIALLVLNGIVGLVLFLTVVLVVIGRLRRATKNAQNALAAGMLAVTIAWLVNGMSIPCFFSERIQELYWSLVAVAVAPALSSRTQPIKRLPAGAQELAIGASTPS